MARLSRRALLGSAGAAGLAPRPGAGSPSAATGSPPPPGRCSLPRPTSGGHRHARPGPAALRRLRRRRRRTPGRPGRSAARLERGRCPHDRRAARGPGERRPARPARRHRRAAVQRRRPPPAPRLLLHGRTRRDAGQLDAASSSSPTPIGRVRRPPAPARGPRRAQRVHPARRLRRVGDPSGWRRGGWVGETLLGERAS